MRRLKHFLWVCRVVSPFSTRAQILDQAPAPIRWELVFAAASSHLILPFIHPCLEEKGLLELAPPEARAALEQVYRLNADRNAALAGQVRRVSSALNRAGIVPVWLKGAARLIEGTKWSTMRPMLDLDLWIPAGDMAFAIEALKAEGYGTRGPDKPGTKHDAPLYHDAETARVEVHHHLVDPAFSRVLPNERLLAGARFFEWKGRRVGVPSAGDQMLNIVSQGTWQQLRLGIVQTRRLLEFVELCAGNGAANSLDLVREAYRQAGEAAYAESYLALAGALFGLPGEFRSRAIPKAVLLRMYFPRLHALWHGYTDMRRYLRDSSLAKPREFVGKLSRRTWTALKRKDAW